MSEAKASVVGVDSVPVDSDGDLDESMVTGLSDIADLIYTYWGRPYFGAKPYIQAMCALTTFDRNEMYYQDRAQSVVLYFLCNAQTWRGPEARIVKKFLKKKYGCG